MLKVKKVVPASVTDVEWKKLEDIFSNGDRKEIVFQLKRRLNKPLKVKGHVGITISRVKRMNRNLKKSDSQFRLASVLKKGKMEELCLVRIK